MKKAVLKNLVISVAVMLMMWVMSPDSKAQNNETPISFSYIQRNDTLFISGETTPEGKIDYKGKEVTHNFSQWGSTGFNDFTNMVFHPNILVINEGMKTIREGAFAGFQIVSVIIPGSVTSIDNGAFYNCDKIQAYTVDAANANYSSSDGVLYNRDKTILLACPNGKTGTCSIPASVTGIADRAFHNSSRYYSKLSDIYVNWTNPPVINKNSGFFDFPKTACLHIPAGTKKNYKNAGWNKFFKKIKEEQLYY
jgi:hypothetical protein